MHSNITQARPLWSRGRQSSHSTAEHWKPSEGKRSVFVNMPIFCLTSFLESIDQSTAFFANFNAANRILIGNLMFGSLRTRLEETLYVLIESTPVVAGTWTERKRGLITNALRCIHSLVDRWRVVRDSSNRSERIPWLSLSKTKFVSSVVRPAVERLVNDPIVESFNQAQWFAINVRRGGCTT